MKRLIMILLFIMLPVSLWAASFESSVRKAMDELQAKKGSTSLCVISNALYVDAAAVDTLSDLTGCTIGKGNMLFVHSPSKAPLQAALFRRDSRDMVLLSRTEKDTPALIKVNISLEKLYDEAYWKTVKEKLGKNVTFAAILNAWADGAPYDFLKCVEYHNHFCPGVTSGYLLACFMQKKFPLIEGQSYVYIASPVWCKEDAIQTLLDITPGKRSLITRNISKDSIPVKQAAGILVVRDTTEKAGTAYVLSFDWEKANSSADKKSSGMKKNPLSWKDNPETYCSVVKECTLTPEVYEKLIQSENPYTVLYDAK